MFELKDSGVRHEFKTGALRDTEEGKGRYDLISTYATRRRAIVLQKGAEGKYGARNWEKGLSISRCISSAKRHLDQYLQGLTDEDHLAQAGFNIDAIMHFEELYKLGKLTPEQIETIFDLPWHLERIKKDVQEQTVAPQETKITPNRFPIDWSKIDMWSGCWSDIFDD